MTDEITNKISEAEKKIKYAEFLMDREDKNNFLPAIAKHTVQAANLVSKAILDIDEKSASSPQLMSKALGKLDGPAAEFSKHYVQIFQLSAKQNIAERDIVLALRQVRTFVDWVKDEHGGEIVEPLTEEEPIQNIEKSKPIQNIEKPQEINLQYLAERAKSKEEVEPLPEEENTTKKKSFFGFWK